MGRPRKVQAAEAQTGNTATLPKVTRKPKTGANKARQAAEGLTPFGKPRVSKEQKEAVTALLAQGLGTREIAREVGVSTSVVHKARLRSENAVGDEGEEARKVYARLLRKRLPIRERVRIWADLARSTTNPFVATRALGRIEELEGIVTPKERKESEVKQQLPPSLFLMAPGSAVFVSAAPPGGESRPVIAPVASLGQAKSPEVADSKANNGE